MTTKVLKTSLYLTATTISIRKMCPGDAAFNGSDMSSPHLQQFSLKDGLTPPLFVKHSYVKSLGLTRSRHHTSPYTDLSTIMSLGLSLRWVSFLQLLLGFRCHL